MEKVIGSRVVEFIEANGSELDRARLNFILNGIQPGDEILRQIIDLQNQDGGFAHALARGNLSTINETLNALWKLNDLGLIGSRTAEKALAYLIAYQCADGGWDESPAICQYDPPPWAIPGDLKARLYLSAYATYRLGAGSQASHPAFQKGLAFLLPHQDKSGRFYGFRHTTWIAASAFAMAGESYSGIFERGLAALEAIPAAEWEASQLAWALDCLYTAGVTLEQPFVQRALAELIKRQALDGSWASEDGPAYTASATVEAIKVLKHYGVI